MHYFAYGSNMSSRRLRQRVASARFVSVATLKSHVLKFHKISDKDGSGKCDAYQSSSDTDMLYGVVYTIEGSEKPLLDAVEGLGAGYDIKDVCVTSNSGESFDAFTYYATSIDDALVPLCWYKHHVVAGAEEHRLPASYIEALRAISTVSDTDGLRAARELSIYKE